MEVNKPLECDVLVAGGGSAGMMAAIAAADAGARTIIAEKANTRRSGNGATGNDHFQCYIPEVHGSEGAWLKLLALSQEARGGRDKDISAGFMRESMGVVLDWEQWGIPMRPHGDWEFTGHCKPGQQGIHLKYEGVNQKPTLTKTALKRGVKILNRHPLSELICDETGAVCGAILVDLTEDTPKLQVVRAKAVVIATAGVSRISGETTMGWMFNAGGCPASTATGRIAAYKAGARLVNVDNMLSGGADFKFFHRGGKATWVGVYSDLEGKPLGSVVQKPDWRYGDYTADLWQGMFAAQYEAGNPVFMNCSQGTEEDLAYMKWALVHEGNSATLQHLEDEGFDFRTHMVEYGYSPGGGPSPFGNGIDIEGSGATTVPGLFAAGQVTGNGIGGVGAAATQGRISGRSAAAYAQQTELKPAEERPVVAETLERYTRLLANEVSTATPTWQEANIAIMQTNWSYMGGKVRSERMLQVGLSHLRRIMGKLEQLHCENSHDFMHCLEVQDIAAQSEICYLAALSRKESRGMVKSVDYPWTDPAMDGKLLTIQLQDGQGVTGARPRRM